MKKLSNHKALFGLLFLFAAGLWQACRPKHEDVPDPASRGADSTYFTTFYLGCKNPDGTKGIALLYVRQIVEKGILKKAEVEGGDYINFSYRTYNEIASALQIGHSALMDADPVVGKYKSPSAYWEDIFKAKSGFVKRVSLTTDQARGFMEQKAVDLTVRTGPASFDWGKVMVWALSLVATPAYAETAAGVQGETSWGYVATGIAGTVAGIAVGGAGVAAANAPYLPAAVATLSGSATVVAGAVFFANAAAVGLGVYIIVKAWEGQNDSPEDKMYEDAQRRMKEEDEACRTFEGCQAYKARNRAGGTTNDPVISGLDGASMLIHPAGEFWAIRSKNDAFAAQVRFEPVLRPNGVKTEASTTTSLAIRTGKDVVSFTVKPLVIHVNGKQIGNDFKVYPLSDGAYLTGVSTDMHYEVISDFGDKIEVRLRPDFNISWYVRTVPGKRRNQVEGLLGQYNDNPSDDFQDRSGNVYTRNSSFEDIYKKFVPDWRLKQPESIMVYPGGKTTESYTIPDFPVKRTSLFDFDQAERDHAEKVCRNAGLTSGTELSDCMIDVLMTGMDAMAEQMALGIRLREETAAMFRRHAPFPGAGREGAIAQTIGTRIYAGLGAGHSDWYAYDPGADRWEKKAGFPASEKGWYAAATFVIGGRLFLAGGINGAEIKAQSALWEYDAGADKWTRRKDVPGAARYNAAGFAIGGKGYVVFGANAWGLSQSAFPTGGTLFEYDPSTDAWATKAAHPASRGGHNIADKTFTGVVMEIDGRAFVNAGSNAPYEHIYGWYEYVPAADKWEPRARITGITSRYFSIGKKAYVLSGQMANGKLTEYDLTTDSWTKYPGKGVFFPVIDNADNLSYIRKAAAYGDRAYFGLGSKNNEWWSFTP